MATKEQFILLVIHIAMANSFALINIRNINEDELIDKLVKVLDSGKSERTVLKNHVDVRRSRKDLHNAHITFERLRQIKNRSPYGPHDVNSQTENEPIYKVLKRGLDRNKTSENFTKFWQKLKNLKNRFLEKGKRHDRSHLNRLRQENGNKRSRSNLRSRSGEEHDPLAPGKVPYNIEMHDATTVKTNKWLPSYPYWNYWTYDKSLYQDDCKGDTIKVGALCIRPPPH